MCVAGHAAIVVLCTAPDVVVGGYQAHGHICVTKAMKAWLHINFGVHATVVYDKAPSFFKEADAATKHELFTRLSADFPKPAGSSATDTLFTRLRSCVLPRSFVGDSTFS